MCAGPDRHTCGPSSWNFFHTSSLCIKELLLFLSRRREVIYLLGGRSRAVCRMLGKEPRGEPVASRGVAAPLRPGPAQNRGAGQFVVRLQTTHTARRCPETPSSSPQGTLPPRSEMSTLRCRWGGRPCPTVDSGFGFALCLRLPALSSPSSLGGGSPS